MKRCPHCSFLYHDSDQLCDLDQTPLVADHSADVGAIEHSEQEAGKLSPNGRMRRRKLSLKTISASIVAGLIIGLTMLLSYQRMRLEASQAPSTIQAKTSQARAAQASRVSLVAQQVSNEVSTNAALAQPESVTAAAADNTSNKVSNNAATTQHDSVTSAAPENTSHSAKPSSSSTTKATLNTRPDAVRVRVSSNPVSTGDVAKTGRGPVTIRLANGSTLQADEVWRTKAGIWYRRKGIVTLLKPNQVRSTND